MQFKNSYDFVLDWILENETSYSKTKDVCMQLKEHLSHQNIIIW